MHGFADSRIDVSTDEPGLTVGGCNRFEPHGDYFVRRAELSHEPDGDLVGIKRSLKVPVPGSRALRKRALWQEGLRR